MLLKTKAIKTAVKVNSTLRPSSSHDGNLYSTQCIYWVDYKVQQRTYLR